MVFLVFALFFAKKGINNNINKEQPILFIHSLNPNFKVFKHVNNNLLVFNEKTNNCYSFSYYYDKLGKLWFAPVSKIECSDFKLNNQKKHVSFSGTKYPMSEIDSDEYY